MLFTSFICLDKEAEVSKLYYNNLIPIWLDIHKEYFEKISIVTNITEVFSDFSDLNLIKISLNDAFCNTSINQKNIFHTQVGCWKQYLNTLYDNDTCIYLDPDAFMLNDTITTLVNDVVDVRLCKKKISYGEFDAGIAILRKTKKTLEILDEITDYMKQVKDECIIEHFFNNNLKEKNQFYLPWSKLTILLRGTLCGFSDPSIIHGYTIPCERYSNNTKDMLELISRKELLRKRKIR